MLFGEKSRARVSWQSQVMITTSYYIVTSTLAIVLAMSIKKAIALS